MKDLVVGSGIEFDDRGDQNASSCTGWRWWRSPSRRSLWWPTPRLKDRVLDVATLVDTLERIAGGGTVLDPEVVRHLLTRQSTRTRVAALPDRERDVLSLMAEGRSNRAIARELHLNEKTVESHTASMFTKLDLIVAPDDHRRVLAVLAWMQA